MDNTTINKILDNLESTTDKEHFSILRRALLCLDISTIFLGKTLEEVRDAVKDVIGGVKLMFLGKQIPHFIAILQTVSNHFLENNDLLHLSGSYSNYLINPSENPLSKEKCAELFLKNNIAFLKINYDIQLCDKKYGVFYVELEDYILLNVNSTNISQLTLGDLITKKPQDMYISSIYIKDKENKKYDLGTNWDLFCNNNNIDSNLLLNSLKNFPSIIQTPPHISSIIPQGADMDINMNMLPYIPLKIYVDMFKDQQQNIKS